MVGASAGAADVRGGDGDAEGFVVIALKVCPISVMSFGSDDGSSGARPAASTFPGDLGKLGG